MSPQMPKPPTNVLLFITDGHRTDTLGCYGNRLGASPTIDAFAEDGIRFDRSFCTHSVCQPTRASIFTGRYPHVHGVWANGCALPRREVTLPQVLAENGYATCAAGKVHLDPQQAYEDRLSPIVDTPYFGFQEVHLSENFIGHEYLRFVSETYPELAERARTRDHLPEEAHDLHWITSQAIDFVERQVAAGKPFMCSCSFHELCPPSRPPGGFAGSYDPADMTVPELRADDLDKKPSWYRRCYETYLTKGRQPDETKLRTHIASMYDQLRFIDKQFGRVLDTLKRLGVYEDTIILFTADHGLSLCDHWQWRHGPFMFDQIINVPMIWRVPGLAKGQTTDALVESVDIMSTVLSRCGIDSPAGAQGQPILTEAGICGRGSVLAEERCAPDLIGRDVDPEDINQYCVRTDDWKLVHYVDQPIGELYDLKNDPGEFDNLWDDPDYRGQRSDMEGLLLERMLAAQDPLPVRHYNW